MGFKVAVDGRGHGFDLHPPGVHGVPAQWGGEGGDGRHRGGTEAHVGGRGNLPPQRRQVTGGRQSRKRRGEGGHGDVVGILDLDGGVREGGGRHPATREEEIMISDRLR